MSSLSQQASAVETAVRMMAGAIQKPLPRERDHILEQLRAASATLRNLEHDKWGYGNEE